MFQTERPSTMKVSEELTGEIHCLFYCAAHGSARHSWQRSKKVTRRSFSLGHAYAASGSGVASPKFLGSKSLTLREQRYNCLGRRFSKHKMTRYAKNLGGAWPPDPMGTPLASSTRRDAHCRDGR